MTDATGHPVERADVILLGLGAAVSDSGGRFAFRGVPPGPVLIRVQRIGFSPILRTTMYDGVHHQFFNLTFDQAVSLTPVIVRDSTTLGSAASGFERRRTTSQGLYFTEEEIARRGPSRVEHLLMTVQGLQVDSAGVVHVDRGRTSIYGDNCGAGVQLFVDGVAVSSDYGLRNLSARSIRGIEIYRGVATTPVELRSPRMACGTVAIWTK